MKRGNCEISAMVREFSQNEYTLGSILWLFPHHGSHQ
jgi:hypothetical protein